MRGQWKSCSLQRNVKGDEVHFKNQAVLAKDATISTGI
jgi:hypothetical protein